MRLTQRLGAAGVVGLSLVLVGCTDGGEPPPTPSSSTEASTSTTTPTSSASPTETVALPVMPDLARTETDVGAVAFVEHWFALVNYGYRTGETEPVRDLSETECTACDGFIDLIESLTEDGSRLETDAVVLETANAPTPEDGLVLVNGTYSRPANTVIEAEGARTTETVSPREAEYIEAALEWTAEGWILLELGT